jgi:4-nitrophenyl phosphatase
MLNDAIAELKRVKEYFQSTDLAPTILETSADVNGFMKKFDTVMFDCDGVLYRSPHPTPDAALALKSLISQQKRVIFVTNNGAVGRPQLREKITNFLGLDVDLLTDDMMVGSAYSCAQFLLRQNRIASDDDLRCRKVFCIGSEGLCNELERTGFAVVHANDEANSFMSRDDLAGFDFNALLKSEQSSDVDAVVIGHDTDFTYRKLSIATVLLQWNPKALLVATNLDAYDLTGSDGRHIPGNGALVKAVRFECALIHYVSI